MCFLLYTFIYLFSLKKAWKILIKGAKKIKQRLFENI